MNNFRNINAICVTKHSTQGKWWIYICKGPIKAKVTLDVKNVIRILVLQLLWNYIPNLFIWVSKISSKCDICDITFFQQHELQRHYNKVHKNLKEFRCDNCGRDFDSIPTLRIHVDSIHKGLKTQCDICKKDFKNLRSHTRVVHQKIKNHKCDSCEKAFHLPKDLKLHIGAIHDKKPMSCQNCDKVLANARTFNSFSQWSKMAPMQPLQ